MMDTSEAVRTLGFDSASQPQHYLDMPTGGRIKIAVASSNRSNPDARVYVYHGLRKMRQSDEALIPAGTYSKHFGLGCDLGNPAPTIWNATMTIYDNPAADELMSAVT